MVNQEKNDKLISHPTMAEIKEVVYSMNPQSAAGPDGINRHFFQKCLHIINKDLSEVIMDFFTGQEIPKYFSYSCIVLLPQVSNPKKVKEFRPISLSNFISKIIYKLLSKRWSPILLVLPQSVWFFKW